MAFTVTVIANFIALAQGGGMPPPWVTYSPLLPLALLLFTGLYRFVLPYATRWRSGRRMAARWARGRGPASSLAVEPKRQEREQGISPPAPGRQPRPDPRPRRPGEQPEGCQRRDPQAAADGVHRRLGIGQVVAGLRH